MTILFISKWVAEKAFITGTRPIQRSALHRNWYSKISLELCLDGVAQVMFLTLNCWVDGDSLTTILKMEKLINSYLNFSDPWPETSWEASLTYKTFLDTFKQILSRTCQEIHLKQIIEGLFEYSLVSFHSMAYWFGEVWLDLHASIWGMSWRIWEKVLKLTDRCLPCRSTVLAYSLAIDEICGIIP